MRKADPSATGRGRVEDEEEAAIAQRRPAVGRGWQFKSGSDLEGSVVLGNDNEIESVSSKGEKMVDAAALQIEWMG